MYVCVYVCVCVFFPLPPPPPPPPPPVQRQQLKVCLVNARSLRNKFHDLAAIAFLENFDIIGVTESWVNTEKETS